MKFFDGWISLFRNRRVNRDIENWARIEYKNDSEFAYNHMIVYGTAPSVGVR